MYGESVAEISRTVEKKRRLVRHSLQARHVHASYHVNVRLNNLYDWTRRLDMAVKSKAKEAPKKAEFRGFFNCEIPTDAKADCKAFIRQDEEIALLIEEAVASGYKLTVVKDGRTDGYQASMQCNDAKSVNAGLCMTAYAAHWYDALAVLMWKHFVFLGKTWEESEKEVPREDFG